MSYEEARQNHVRQFIVGKTYLTQEGKRVKIINEQTKYGVHYTCVQGDDGETRVEEVIGKPGVYEIIEGNTLGWRYDRSGDVGRCTGSNFDMSDPRNLVPGSEQPD